MSTVFKVPLVWLLSVSSVSLWLIHALAAEPLPNTKPLTEDGDLAAKMVAGIHKYLDRELAAAPQRRESWKVDRLAEEGRKRSPNRSRRNADVCGRYLGLVDERCRRNSNTSPGRANRRSSPRSTAAKFMRSAGRCCRGGCRGTADRAEGQAEGERGGDSRTADQSPGGTGRTCDDEGDARSPCGSPGTGAGSSSRHSSTATTTSPATQAEPATNLPAPRVRLPHGLRDGPHARSATRCRRSSRRWIGSTAETTTAQGRRDRVRRRRHARPVRRRRWTSASRPCRSRVTSTRAEELDEEPIDRNVWGLLKEFGDAEVGCH